jgi:acid stress-induced BolA-like protein IbaG/YrbA
MVSQLRVREILIDAFAGIELDLEEMSSGRITGDAIWTGFEGLDQVDRQQLLRNALRNKLQGEATQVGVLLTFTPDEIHSMQEA